ncbi:hypothetical protein F4779DRAFT_616724 [Xylariaceae sp. FL0662B]|nr:hypothetical protein F4779DRAFT_616724 [Xylariaceae sp. FL0662B]
MAPDKEEQNTLDRRCRLSFMSLPPELRDMIWEFAIPQRHVMSSDFFGSITSSQPIIAYVCRESRAIACRHGSWWPALHEEKSKVWFDPKNDAFFAVRLCTDMIVLKELVSHIETLTLWTREIKLGSHYLPTLAGSLKLMAICPEESKNIKLVNVLYHGVLGSWSPRLRYNDLTKRFDSSVETATVDLWDRDGVRQAINTMSDDSTSHLLKRMVMSEYDQLIADIGRIDQRLQRCNGWWKKIIVRDAQLGWLSGKYWLEKPPGVRVPEVRASGFEAEPWELKEWELRDMEHPWVKETLAKMPELRPVVSSTQSHDYPFRPVP